MKKGQRRITRIFKDVEQLSYGKQVSRQKLSDWTWARIDMEVDYKTLSGLDKVNRELLFTAFSTTELWGLKWGREAHSKQGGHSSHRL